MNIFTVNTPFNIEVEFALATFGKRLLAWIIDIVIIYFYCYIVLMFFYGEILNWRLGSDFQRGFEILVVIFTVVLPVMFYHFLFEYFAQGQSVGKKIMGLKVINIDGASASLGQLLIRSLLYIPNYFLLLIIYMNSVTLLLYIILLLFLLSIPDGICLLINKYSQKIGDIAAGTIVIDTRYKTHIDETIHIALEKLDNYKVIYPQVTKIKDKDINGIKNLLDKRHQQQNLDYIYNIVSRIENVMEVKMKESDPFDFFETLILDYNYITANR